MKLRIRWLVAAVVVALGFYLASFVPNPTGDGAMLRKEVELHAEKIRVGCERDPWCIRSYERADFTFGDEIPLIEIRERAQAKPEWFVLAIIKEEYRIRLRYLFGDTELDTLFFHDQFVATATRNGFFWYDWRSQVDEPNQVMVFVTAPHYPRIWFCRGVIIVVTAVISLLIIMSARKAS